MLKQFNAIMSETKNNFLYTRNTNKVETNYSKTFIENRNNYNMHSNDKIYTVIMIHIMQYVKTKMKSTANIRTYLYIYIHL